MTDSPRDHELERLRERYHENREGRIFAPLADAYRKRGDLDEALRVCRKGLALHPDYSSAHVILAKIHLDRGDQDAAETAFDRVLELDPQNLLALANLGRLADAAGRTEIAVEYWTRLLELDPDHEEAAQRLEEAEDPTPADDVDDGVEIVAEETDEAEADEGDGEEDIPVAPGAEVGADAEPESEPESKPEPQPEATSSSGGAGASPSAIATTTLADIYYAQGFKAKALAIYERLLASGSDDAVVRAKAERIRNEMAEIESHLPAAPEASGLTTETEPAGRKGETALSARFVDEDAAAGARESGPAESGDDAVDEEDFTQFRSWLDRVK